MKRLILLASVLFLGLTLSGQTRQGAPAVNSKMTAYEAGTIHEYEIDVMMDQLGW